MKQHLIIILLKSEVDGVPFNEWLTSTKASMGTDPGFQQLDADKAHAQYNEAKTCMETFAEDSKAWKVPFDAPKVLGEFMSEMRKYEAGVFEIAEVVDCVDRFAETDKKGEKAQRRTYNENRVKHEVFFGSMGKNVASAFARAISWHTYAMAKNPLDVSLKEPPSVKIYACGSVPDRGSFEIPLVIEAVPDGDVAKQNAANWLQLNFAKHVAEMSPNALTWAATQVDKLKGKPDMVGNLQCADHVTPFVYNPDQYQIFTPSTPVKEIQLNGRTMHQELSIVGYPPRGISGFITAYRGTVAILVLNREQVLKHPDFESWLRTAKADALKDNEVALLRTGDTLWLPSGFAPLILGLPSDTKDLEQVTPRLAERGRYHRASKANVVNTESFVLGINLLFEKVVDEQLPPALRGAICAAWLQGKAYCPKGYAKQDKAKEWQVAITPDEGAE